MFESLFLNALFDCKVLGRFCVQGIRIFLLRMLVHHFLALARAAFCYQSYSRELSTLLGGSTPLLCTVNPLWTLWCRAGSGHRRSEEHTSELQSLMRISYAVFCLKKKKNKYKTPNT